MQNPNSETLTLKSENFVKMGRDLVPSFLVGDHIGMESCNEMENDGGVKNGDRSDVGFGYSHCRRRDQRWEKKREFPPPIPLLARTGNLNSHMPWVLKRCYTSDGRLILREEKVKHHEYFRAHRSNGRLTLHLVPLDDEGLDPDEKIESFGENNDGDDEKDENEEVGREMDDGEMKKFESFESGKEDDDQEDDYENDGEKMVDETMKKLVSCELYMKDDQEDGEESEKMDNKIVEETMKKLICREFYEKDDQEEDDEIKEKMNKLVSKSSSSSSLSSMKEKGNNGGIGSNGGGKCLNINSTSTSFSCIFDMPVTTIRSVQI